MAGKMRPYTALVSKLLFPAHELLKSHTTLGIRRTLEKTQWWSADEIANYQLTRLRALLTEAGKSVPYYRQLFADLNFEPARISSVSDLARLPFLTKPLIRQHSNALKHESATRLTRSNTGGSSAEPENQRLARRTAGIGTCQARRRLVLQRIAVLADQRFGQKWQSGQI